LDVLHLLRLAGHIPAGAINDRDEDDRVASLVAMLRQAGRDGYLTDERYQFLQTLIEWVRVTAPTTGAPPSVPPSTPGVTY